MIGISQARLPLALAAATLILSFHVESASSNEPPAQPSPSSSSDSKQQIDTVTVEARRIRELQRQINHFVSHVVVKYMYDSLERWDSPICPLVAGLSQDPSEFVLARLSEIARTAHAPLAGEHCDPNLYVVVTADPELLIRKWWNRDRRLLNTCDGYGYVRDFMHSREPVRVWYNAGFRSKDGGELSSNTSILDLNGLTLSVPLSSCAAVGGRPDSRLQYGAVKALTSVIVVVDAKRLANLNVRQLADYVAMVGFAQLHLNADTGTLPTILSLFRQPDQAPQSLTQWDQAFLHSLYTTEQASVMQVDSIKDAMLKQIERAPPASPSSGER